MSEAIPAGHQRSLQGNDMSLFSSRFYKYLTKYMKFIAQKKQLAKSLEIVGKFRPLILEKISFSRKMGAVMPNFEERDQKKLEQKYQAKVSSILENLVRSAVTIQRIVQSLQNSLWKMQQGMCGMSKIYEALNYNFPNKTIALKNMLKFFDPHTYWFLLPSLLRFCCRSTHKCFRKRVTIFLR